jgi:hypothetical protein
MIKRTFIGLIAVSLLSHAPNFAPFAHAQGAAQPAGSSVQTPASRSTPRPAGRPSAVGGQAQPRSAKLTAAECRKLGGKTTIDDSGSCKLRMRCTIIHASGDVYSSCIDEAK